MPGTITHFGDSPLTVFGDMQESPFAYSDDEPIKQRHGTRKNPCADTYDYNPDKRVE